MSDKVYAYRVTGVIEIGANDREDAEYEIEMALQDSGLDITRLTYLRRVQ